MIPPLIHRVWLGPKMPDAYAEYGKRWDEMNPGWLRIDWDAEGIAGLPLVNRRVFDDIAEHGANTYVTNRPRDVAVATQQADVLAYELLFMFGGVYVNCDMEPVRPLSELLPRIEPGKLFAGDEDGIHLCNAVMGAPANHPVLGMAVTLLERRFFNNRTLPMEKVTGPVFLTHLRSQYPDAVQTLSRQTFYPVGGLEVPVGGDASGHAARFLNHPDTIAVHHWGHRSYT